MRKALLSLGCLAALPGVSATPANAETREFCASRPGLGTPSCTVAPGAAMIETGVAAWDHQSDASMRDDTLTLGDFNVRIGLDDRTEMQLGLTSYVHDRVRDRASGAVAASGGLGDATLAVRRGLAGPNGPVAVQAFITLPVGHGPGTAGDWGAGVLIPIAIHLPRGFELDLTPEVDAAVNADSAGRHLAYGSVIGVAHDLAPGLAATIELSAFRDEDPAEAAMDTRVAGSLAWQAAKNFQVDLELDRGLSASAPDRTLAVGVALRLP